jgi:Uma2 family endonuclease
MREPLSNLGPLTIDEYLQFENASERRHEFVAGRVYAMSGTTARHNRIALNVHRLLHAAARGGPCAAYSIDLKVRAPRDRVYYPDGVVVCAPHDGDTLVFDEPCLVVEVTSRGSRRTDRGEKLDAYLAIPSLRAYLIAEHDRRHVTLYARVAGREWTREEIVASGSVTLPCPATTFSLDDLYENVEMPLRVREEPEDEDEWSDLVEVET